MRTVFTEVFSFKEPNPTSCLPWQQSGIYPRLMFLLRPKRSMKPLPFRSAIKIYKMKESNGRCDLPSFWDPNPCGAVYIIVSPCFRSWVMRVGWWQLMIHLFWSARFVYILMTNGYSNDQRMLLCSHLFGTKQTTAIANATGMVFLKNPPLFLLIS